MNIFFLDWNPSQSVIQNCDKHVVKMLLETTQLLYTVYHLQSPELLLFSPLQPYKITHKNHPCSIWIRENLSNFLWLLHLGYEYCREYTYRYEKIHSCQKHILWMTQNIPDLPRGKMSLPPQAMPEKYKCENPIEAYRNYYLGEKLHFVRYTKREKPEWILNYVEN